MSRVLAVSIALVSVGGLVAGCPGPTPEDAGPGDVGADAGACTGDSDCDDGLYCTGEERCVMGACVLGTPVRCADELECTTDRCSEMRRACTFSAPDVDGDGHGDIGCVGSTGDDCDDADAERFPGNVELCDPAGHDEDCDTTTRGGLDEDDDSFESAACCNPSADGTPNCGDDCNDAVALVNPRGLEICNLRDDDCDGMDDAAEGLTLALYVDADRDGYGDSTLPQIDACVSQAGYSVDGGDCDDRPGVGIARSPGQPEFCDMIDNDCNGPVDDMTRAVAWYADVDGDGFGDEDDVVMSCAPIPNRSLLGTDCDDAVASRNPGTAEVCNGLDDDCNGTPDAPAGDGLEDDDLDGIADVLCGGPSGIDCDDLSAAVGGGSLEVCDGRDNDCDMRSDEGVDMAVFYADRDGDGYGSISSGAFVGCGAPAGFVGRAGDCADENAERNPLAGEDCNGIDDDCDGAADEAPATMSCPGGASALGGACSGGRCTLVCIPGAGDCDGNGVNGCETPLNTVSNCQTCGRTCANTNAVTTTCGAMGRCSSVCNAGFFDCTGEGDGCETRESPLDCGGCGARCPTPPGTVATCAASSCGTSCVAGRFDCDGNPANGCESTFSCAMCATGTAQCDFDPACEDLLEDEANCGSCGRVCGLGSECSGGGCDHIVDIAIGDRHTVALRANGQVLCWGQNDEGQCDPGMGPATLTTPAAIFMRDAIAITAGARHTCAIRASGRITCWGSNAMQQLGGPGPGPVDVMAIPGAATAIDAGGDHTCAIAAGQIFCWGANGSRESAPMLVAGSVPPTFLGELMMMRPATLIAVGDGYSCYGTDLEVANCWGAVPGRGMRPFGSGSGWDSEMWTYFFVGTDVTGLEAGGTHVCITHRLGGPYCLGLNDRGQLGDATTVTPSEAVQAVQLSGARELWLGDTTSCARVGLDRLVCVGGDAFGSLGDGTVGAPAFSATATTPMGLSRVRTLSRGGDDDHVCAVDLSGRVQCWGHNNGPSAVLEHRLGLGVPDLNVPVPTVLPSLGY